MSHKGVAHGLSWPDPTARSWVRAIVYCFIATRLIKGADFSDNAAWTGAVTLIQRFSSPLILNGHIHML